MSTGSYTQQLEAFPRGSCGGTAYYRRQFYKAWNGADLTAAEKLAGRPFPAHSYTLNLSSIDRGEVVYKPTNSKNLWSNCFGGGSNPGQTWDSNAELKLLGRLGSLVKGHDFNAGIFLGTGHQSAKLIGSSAERLVYGLIALKKGLGPKAILNALSGAEAKRLRPTPIALRQGIVGSRFKKQPKKSAKWEFTGEHFEKRRSWDQPLWEFQGEHRDVELSRRWLELSYGWMPLLSDAYEATLALGNHVQKVHTKSFRARYKMPAVTKVTQDSYRRLDERVQTRTQLIYTLSREKDFVLEMAGLGLMDPYSVVWELVPWSFAIDWFMPIGDALASAAYIPKLRGSWVRTLSRRTWSRGTTIHTNYTHVRDYTSYYYYVDRTAGATTLQVPLPQFKSPLSKSWKRALNQIALLGQMRRRNSSSTFWST